MKRIAVIGAGLTGIFSAEYLSRKGFDITIFDSRDGSFNHKGVLRFKESSTLVYLNSDFKKICVEKGFIYGDSCYEKPSLSMCNSYSKKVSGGIYKRSITTRDSGERYVMKGEPKTNCKFVKNKEINSISDLSDFDFIVSTLPISHNLKLCGISDSYFFDIIDNSKKEIFIYDFKIKKSDVYQSFYFCNSDNPIYRVSLTGDIGCIESVNCIENGDIICSLSMCGIDSDFSCESTYNKKYKISSIDEKVRRSKIAKMTSDFGLFSVGRFAIWKPGLMVDDLPEDLDKIVDMINHGFEYEQNKYK